MSGKPSAAAMRAANAIADDQEYQRDSLLAVDWARMIDRETGLPDLLAALEMALAYVAHEGTPEEVAEVEAAISKASGSDKDGKE